MPQLYARLLGGLEFYDDNGDELSLAARKARALVAFLIVEREKWHTRERLADLLWGDRQQAQARHSLTQALGSIRKLGDQLGVALIETTGNRIRLTSGTVIDDLATFRRAADSDPEVAAENYKGPLLDGFTPGSQQFEEWAEVERAVLHKQACQVFERAAETKQAAGDQVGAIELMQHLISLDPLRETAHQRLMKLLLANGDRTAAIRQYHQVEGLLSDELGVAPSEETVAVFQEVRAAKSGPKTNITNEGAPSVAEEEKPPVLDRPSIAVVPFVNMSADPEQQFFADGITEDIITALSNVRTFAVLARNSTFVYKGKSVDARQVGRDLNVNYMIEGSVRRAGDRVRVTAQLIDTTTGDHLWADRYDGTLDDIFDVQDRIASTIVGTIEPELVRAVGQRLQGRPPANMATYDYLLRGLAYMHKVTPEDTKKGLACFEKAIELDANYGRAYAFASWCYRREVEQGGRASLSKRDQLKAIDLARKALQCDRNDPFVLVYAGATLQQIDGNIDECLALTERALSMHPNSHRFWNLKALSHALNGDTAEAIEAAERAISLAPRDTAIWNSYLAIAQARLQELCYNQAADFAKRALRHNENLAPAFHILAAAQAHLGNETDAKEALASALQINPGMTLRAFPKNYHVGRFKNLDAYLCGLRKAGLPD